MKDASFWSQALFDLGPFALIVFFALVTIPISKSQFEKDKNSRLHQGVYLVNWIFVFLLGVVVTYIWVSLHIVRQAEIRGEIRHIPKSIIITNDADVNDDLYTQKKDSSHRLTLYRWILISPHPMAEGTTIPIVMSKGEDASFEVSLQVKKSFYNGPVIVDYDEPRNVFSLVDGSASTELKMRNLETSDGVKKSSRSYSPSFPFVKTVFAQSDEGNAPLKERLDSPDPVTRRDARNELATGGGQSLPFIDSVLKTEASSYRLKLGCLIALNLMPPMPLEERLSLDSLVFIVRSIGSTDANLRGEARKFLEEKGSAGIEKKLRLALDSPRKPSSRFSDTEIALADMDLLYNLGVKEKDLYKQPQEDSHMAAAISAFSAGWDARKHAANSAQMYFSKALYGWALALADRSAIDKGPSGQKKPELIEAARQKFLEFIAAAQAGGRDRPYPAPAQIEQAKRYLANGTL